MSDRTDEQMRRDAELLVRCYGDDHIGSATPEHDALVARIAASFGPLLDRAQRAEAERDMAVEDRKRDQAFIAALRLQYADLANEINRRAGELKGLPGDKAKRSAYAEVARIVIEARRRANPPTPEPPTTFVKKCSHEMFWGSCLLPSGHKEQHTNNPDDVTPEPPTKPEARTEEPPPVRRCNAIEPGCAEAWPEAWPMDYNPACCRFPKSCSAEVCQKVKGHDGDHQDGDRTWPTTEETTT